jgi:hypothetical protein
MHCDRSAAAASTSPRTAAASALVVRWLVMQARNTKLPRTDALDRIRVYAGPKRARLVRPKQTDFLARVRDRLGILGATASLADRQPPLIYLPTTQSHPTWRTYAKRDEASEPTRTRTGANHT